MCGRYSLATPDPAQIRARFPVGESVEIRRRYNVAPTDDVLAVTSDRDGRPRGELLRWGLIPTWARDAAIGPRLINARAETVAEKPAFRRAFERFRCLIIADGFYEWKAGAAAPKQAFHITQAAGGPFAFAGLWSVWHPPEGDPIRSCSIVTTRANETIAALHDRMPVILAPGEEEPWLDAGTPRSVLADLMQGLDAPGTAVRPVGGAVNDARHDEPDCLDDAVEQTALF